MKFIFDIILGFCSRAHTKFEPLTNLLPLRHFEKIINRYFYKYNFFDFQYIQHFVVFRDLIPFSFFYQS